MFRAFILCSITNGIWSDNSIFSRQKLDFYKSTYMTVMSSLLDITMGTQWCWGQSKTPKAKLSNHLLFLNKTVSRMQIRENKAISIGSFINALISTSFIMVIMVIKGINRFFFLCLHCVIIREEESNSVTRKR